MSNTVEHILETFQQNQFKEVLDISNDSYSKFMDNVVRVLLRP